MQKSIDVKHTSSKLVAFIFLIAFAAALVGALVQYIFSRISSQRGTTTDVPCSMINAKLRVELEKPQMKSSFAHSQCTVD